jgi:hypothetical protein
VATGGACGGGNATADAADVLLEVLLILVVVVISLELLEVVRVRRCRTGGVGLLSVSLFIRDIGFY